ncbi:MAG: amidohydrolase [Bacteroidales bacterium]|nr:amidohydrolase [Bacteroidales bacterium]
MSDKAIIDLRHELHQHPEISNHEVRTSQRIEQFMNRLNPDEVISLASNGKAFIFDSQYPGPTTMFRSELDALPILETSKVKYASGNNHVAHSCGHDGHMAILVGLAQRVVKNPPQKGKIVFLFQPAEEVEQGARDVLEDPKFAKISPDYVFALHNIPGVEKNKILLRNGTFAAASKGMTITLSGKTAHAAEPENGISPAIAIARIIEAMNELISNQSLFHYLTMLTIIHIRMGEVSFGTTPGYAEIMITLRAFQKEDMDLVTKEAECIIGAIAKEEKLSCNISYSEVFPALVNDPECVHMLELAAKENGMAFEYLKNPFRWSEDFSYFTEKYKGAFFGLGAGVHHPRLHNSDYNFPDSILKTGIQMFYSVYQKLNLKS